MSEVAQGSHEILNVCVFSKSEKDMLNRALIGKVGYLSCQDEWKELQLLSAECLYFYGMLYVSLIWKRAVPGSATVLILNTGIPSLSLVETASSLTHSVQPKQCRKVFPFST